MSHKLNLESFVTNGLKLVTIFQMVVRYYSLYNENLFYISKRTDLEAYMFKYLLTFRKFIKHINHFFLVGRKLFYKFILFIYIFILKLFYFLETILYYNINNNICAI